MQSRSCEPFARIHWNLTDFIKSEIYIEVKHNRNNQYVNYSLWYREAEANSFCKKLFCTTHKNRHISKKQGKDCKQNIDIKLSCSEM